MTPERRKEILTRLLAKLAKTKYPIERARIRALVNVKRSGVKLNSEGVVVQVEAWPRELVDEIETKIKEYENER